MFQHKIISILFKISASALFRKFQPRYSYKIYSYIKKECRQNDIDKIIEGNYQNYVIDKLTCEISMCNQMVTSEIRE